MLTNKLSPLNSNKLSAADDIQRIVTNLPLQITDRTFTQNTNIRHPSTCLIASIKDNMTSPKYASDVVF